QQDGTITTCQGKTVRPELDQTELGRIARQQRDTSGPVSIAWLEAPGGTQLLLISASDLCKTEPKEEGF
ncbi:DUF1481 domain-containing protein, partial [Erwinia sp. MYb416]